MAQPHLTKEEIYKQCQYEMRRVGPSSGLTREECEDLASECFEKCLRLKAQSKRYINACVKTMIIDRGMKIARQRKASGIDEQVINFDPCIRLDEQNLLDEIELHFPKQFRILTDFTGAYTKRVRAVARSQVTKVFGKARLCL